MARQRAQTAATAEPPTPEPAPETELAYRVTGGGPEDAGAGVVSDLERRAIIGEPVPYAKRVADRREQLKRASETRRQREEEAFKGDLERVRRENRRRPRVVLKDVPISRIVRETIYNRKLDEARARKYARNFDWRLFQTVSLNQREDGSLNLVDGQHRVAAAALVWGPDVSVPATVTKFGNVGEEAGAFDEINSSRSPLLFQVRFNARLLAGKPDAVAISALIEAAGLRMGEARWVNEAHPGEVTTIGTLSRIYKRYGPMAVAEALGVLRASWGDAPEAYRAGLVEGASLLHVLFPAKVRPERLIAQLRLRTPALVLSEAARFQSGVITRNAVTVTMALHAIYNRSLMVMSQLPALAVRADGQLQLGNAGYGYRKLHPPAAPETFDAAVRLVRLYEQEWQHYATRPGPTPLVSPETPEAPSEPGDTAAGD